MGGSISTDKKISIIINSKTEEKIDINDNQIQDNFINNREALLQLLHKPFFRSSFRKFIIDAWTPSLNEYNNVKENYIF
jgi:hypothetical protein